MKHLTMTRDRTIPALPAATQLQPLPDEVYALTSERRIDVAVSPDTIVWHGETITRPPCRARSHNWMASRIGMHDTSRLAALKAKYGGSLTLWLAVAVSIGVRHMHTQEDQL